jgi:predicted transcriptional regulator
MKLPCEKVVWDVLPAIRAAIAEELANCGLTQQEIARELDMAPSAVSQYLSKKRGYRIVFEDDVKESISQLALDIKEKRVTDIVPRVCRICTQLRAEGDRCSGHDTG